MLPHANTNRREQKKKKKKKKRSKCNMIGGEKPRHGQLKLSLLYGLPKTLRWLGEKGGFLARADREYI